jgi:mono/diheme cytochrome c family protein
MPAPVQIAPPPVQSVPAPVQRAADDRELVKLAGQYRRLRNVVCLAGTILVAYSVGVSVFIAMLLGWLPAYLQLHVGQVRAERYVLQSPGSPINDWGGELALDPGGYPALTLRGDKNQPVASLYRRADGRPTLTLWDDEQVQRVALAAEPNVAGSLTFWSSGGRVVSAMPDSSALPDVARGRRKFVDAGCSACHGDDGQSGIFPGMQKIRGTALTFEQVRVQVRNPRDPSKGMPPFSVAQLSDQDILDIYAWLHTGPTVQALPQAP